MSLWTLLNAATIALFAVTTLYVTLRRAPAPMAPALILSQVSALAWSLGEMLAVYAPDLSSKHAALILLHTGGLVLPLSWLLLAIRFGEAHGLALPWAGQGLRRTAMAITAAFWLLLATNAWHGLYVEPVIHHWNVRQIGWGVAASYCYLLLFVTISIYLTLLRSREIAAGARRQALVLAGASAAPLFMTFAQLATGPHPYPIELGIVGGGIGGVLILTSIYRDDLFNLSPLAVSEVLAQDPSALLFFDARGRLRFASEAADRVLGSEFVGRDRTLDDLAVRLGGGALALTSGGLSERLRAGQPVLAMFRDAGANGGRWLWCEAERIEDRRAGPAGYSVRLQDVTELALLEAERDAVAEELATAERLSRLGSLTADFARRIGEPVDAIHTEASSALEALAERGEGPWLDASLARIVAEATRCGELTHGLLKLARRPRRPSPDPGASLPA